MVSQLSFVRYLQFIEGRLFDWYKTPGRYVRNVRNVQMGLGFYCSHTHTRNTHTTHSLLTGIQRLLLGVAFSIVFSLSNQHFPISLLASDEFAVELILSNWFLPFALYRLLFLRTNGLVKS